jgi:pantoate--beta-alanine ligase
MRPVPVPVERSRVALRRTVAGWKATGDRVGVVPTMGALHEGHLSLVRAARAGADRVVVTLFVNPRQFNSPADLAAYPRTEAEDAALLAPLGVDLLYAPGGEEIYPEGFDSGVRVGGIDVGLEDAFRPGHFEGVALVVLKLLNQTAADRAFFGEKDFQQLLLVRRLARDLDLPAEIVGCPTVREPDGLALSSRNRRLAAADRAHAPALHAALAGAAAPLAAGAAAEPVLAAAREAVLAGGYQSVEYLTLRREADLAPLAAATEPARLLAAAWLGGVRLIDNLAVGPAGTFPG